MASRARSIVSRPALAALALALSSPAAAEVTLDGSLGAPAGPVAGGLLPNGQPVDYLIGPELGAQRDRNLFHSFGLFSIEAGRTGAFTGPAEIQNVIARVTGGEQSRIDGTLRSTIAGASLFLVNPAGVVFGEGAVLSVPGSFYTSTADLVRLADGEDFSASAPGGAPISIAAPESFGFVSPEPAAIELHLPANPLRGATNATLAFVGGDIVIESDGDAPGYLWSPAGAIHLAAVASDGSGTARVGVAPVDGALAVSGPAVGRSIDIRNDAVVSSSNLNPATPFGGAGRGGGDVLVFAQDLVIEDAELRAQTVGRDPGGDVRIQLGGDLVLRKLDPRETGIFAGSGVAIGGGFVNGIDGDGGSVTIEARRVLVEDGATLSTSSLTPGDPGEITIEASESVTLRGRDAGGQRAAVFSNTTVTGEGGVITLRAPLLLMQEGGALVAQTTGSGRGGDIVIEVGQLVLESTARIDSSTRSAAPIRAAGGNIRVRATESVTISGRQDDTEFSGITTIAQPESTGDAGTIEITAPALSIADGGEVSAKALGTGSAGRIVIDAGQSFEVREGFVTTSADDGSGGQISIRATKLVYLRNSEVTTSVLDGAGGGGDLSIDPELVVLDRSRVVANAVAGDGGNIRITAGRFLASSDSRVDASSQLGIDGEVQIDAPDTDLAGELSSLPSTYADPAALLRDSCALRGSNASSFLVVPRERAPAPPDAPLAGPLDPPPGCETP